MSLKDKKFEEISKDLALELFNYMGSFKLDNIGNFLFMGGY